MINWTPDKQRHYCFCYELTSKVKIPVLNLIWALLVWLSVSFFKEIIWDFLIGKGTPDWQDAYANLIGCYDALLGQQKRF